jgi:RNA polymerase sigma factor (sigma-70 family)
MRRSSQQSPPLPPGVNGARRHEDPDPFAERYVRRTAGRLARRRGFARHDEPDIAQALAAKLLKEANAFDPKVAHWNVFVVTVVERYAANLLRHRRAEKRDPGNVTSLHLQVVAAGEGPVEVAQTLCDDANHARLGLAPRGDHDQADLRADVAAFLSGLSTELRDLAGRFMGGASLSQAARDLGVPRTTLQRKKDQLLRLAERSGLRDYL